MFYPEVVRIDLTGDCNLRCKHCQTSMFLKRRKDDLPVALWKKIISQISSCGGRVITLLGGEPLLYPGVKDVIIHARAVGLEVGVVTNGTLVSEDYSAFLADHCLSL